MKRQRPSEKKLLMSRERLRVLASPELRDAGGAGPVSVSVIIISKVNCATGDCSTERCKVPSWFNLCETNETGGL
jgi:hypothetical protein